MSSSVTEHTTAMASRGRLHLHEVAVDGSGELAGLRCRFTPERSDTDRRARFECDRELLCGHEGLVGAGDIELPVVDRGQVPPHSGRRVGREFQSDLCPAGTRTRIDA
jgi:hypothetical protein